MKKKKGSSPIIKGINIREFLKTLECANQNMFSSSIRNMLQRKNIEQKWT